VVISKVEHTDFFTSTRTTKQKYFIIFIKEINKPSYLLAANESTNEWVNRERFSQSTEAKKP
jgi:hypothetical protein